MFGNKAEGIDRSGINVGERCHAGHVFSCWSNFDVGPKLWDLQCTRLLLKNCEGRPAGDKELNEKKVSEKKKAAVGQCNAECIMLNELAQCEAEQ